MTRSVDLLVVVPDLRPGGLTRHTEHLVRAARTRSLRTVVLVVAGHHTVSPDLGESLGASELDAEGLRSLMSDAAVVVVQAAPATLSLLPLARAAGSCLLAVHGSPGTNLTWWGAARVDLLQRLLASGWRLQVLVPAVGYRQGTATELGVPLEDVHVAANVVDVRSLGRAAPAGCDRVLVPMRLANDKAWVLEAAIELARAGDVPLRLVGDGPHEADLTRLLEGSGVRFDVLRSSDLQPDLAVADVVVAVGLVALEAAGLGRRVAVAHKLRSGEFAGVASPATWRELRAGNFAGIGSGAVDARTAWRATVALTDDDLRGLQEVVRREADPQVLLDAVLTASQAATGGRLRVPDDVATLVRVTVDQAADLVAYDGWVLALQSALDDERSKRDVLEHDLGRSRVERSELEGQVRDLEEHQRRLELLGGDTGRLRPQLDELAAERDRLARVADDAHRQLQEVLASTAWRAAAPVRIIGTAKRRAQRLLPYVNRRRLRGATQLLVSGDVRTLRQRVAATEAVAISMAPSLEQGRRPVVPATATPWPRDQPLVTVVIPCFNYGEYVDEAIASVLAQTLGDRVEVVVVDGGSTDSATVAHLEQLAASPPERVRVLLRRDGRHLVGDNRNHGISHARGKYVCCLDADDLLDPRYLELAVFLLERFGYGIVSTATRCFGTVTDTFGLLPEPDLQDMLLANNVTTVAVFAKQDWERAGGFRDTGLGAEHVHEDWRLWVRLAALGARITNITGMELFRYRVHSSDSLSRQEGVPPVRDQRTAVRELNADVVDDAAVAASARAREVELVCAGAHDNMLPAIRDGRPGVLLFLPFLLMGGAEKLLSAVVAHLALVGFRVVVVTTLPADPSNGDTSAWFEAHTSEVFHLPRLLAPHRWDDFVDHLVQAKGIELVWIAGSTWAYERLDRLRTTHRGLQVVDLLFNTVGHTASNRRQASRIDLTLVENAEVEQWLLDRGESADRVVRAESGVDLDVYRPSDLRRPSPTLRVGFSGRFSPEKDPLGFLAIAAAAAREDLEFVMTGAGPLEPQIRERLVRSVPRGRVALLGMVHDVRAHLASLDVLVLPSLLDGRPVVVLEALAMGIPVVASSVGALPELVVDGVTGFLCEPGDTAAFAARLVQLADDRALLAGMRVAAREYAETHLDIRDMLEKYERTLRALLDRRTASSSSASRGAAGPTAPGAAPI